MEVGAWLRWLIRENLCLPPSMTTANLYQIYTWVNLHTKTWPETGMSNTLEQRAPTQTENRALTKKETLRVGNKLQTEDICSFCFVFWNHPCSAQELLSGGTQGTTWYQRSNPGLACKASTPSLWAFSPPPSHPQKRFTRCGTLLWEVEGTGCNE